MSSQIVGVLAAAGQADATAAQMEKGAWVAKNATQYNYQGHYDKYLKKHEACTANSGGTGCSTILSMAGTNSRNLGNVVVNTDDSGAIVSYILLDSASKPFAIMEPAEYKAYIVMNADIQEGYKTSPQWGLDISSTVINAANGQGSKAAESYTLMLSEPEYWGEMALGLALSLAPSAGMFSAGARPARLGVLNDSVFAQVPARTTKAFSEMGQEIYTKAAGRPIETVGDLTEALKQGTIRPNQVPLDYVVIDGRKVISNTRTSTALIDAGIPKSQWHGIDKTGLKAFDNITFDDLVKNQLNKNYEGSVEKARK
ncbi:hypothetical protein [Pseudomonas trivialis]|uniref:hypothetical protein n=1 Tax=Pseudomonas trivialis TaxID=200450 RepID=UPI003BAFF224